MSAKLNELRDKITALRTKQEEAFKEGGDDLDLSADQVDDIRAVNDELIDLSKKEKALSDLENIRAENDAAIAELGRASCRERV